MGPGKDSENSALATLQGWRAEVGERGKVLQGRASWQLLREAPPRSPSFLSFPSESLADISSTEISAVSLPQPALSEAVSFSIFSVARHWDSLVLGHRNLLKPGNRIPFGEFLFS